MTKNTKKRVREVKARAVLNSAEKIDKWNGMLMVFSTEKFCDYYLKKRPANLVVSCTITYTLPVRKTKKV